MSQAMTHSESYAPGTTVEREGVVAVLPRRTVPAETLSAPVAPLQAAPQPVAPPAPAQPAARSLSRSDAAFVGVLGAITALLAARFLLLLSIIGGFILANSAMATGTYTGLSILIAYAVLIVIPLVYLDIETHRRGAR
jgi:predicted lipid-binding transport protein (Tim44 family)